MILKLIFCLLALASAAGAESMKPGEITALQKHIKDSAAKTNTLIMDITQERVLLAFEDKLVSHGKFYLALPGKLRWQIDKPYGSAIVFNHNKVAKFERKGERWHKLDHGGADIIKQIMSQISDWSSGEFQENDMYKAEFLKGARVSLTPRSNELQGMLHRILLDFDQSTYFIKAVTLQEKQGDYVKITFSNPKVNPHIKPKIFSVTEKGANQ